MAAMGTARAVMLLAATFCLQGATECNCDPVRPETMKARQCSLCNEADKQPPEVEIFFLKDINPRKPNRWLALPRVHGSGQHHLQDIPQKQRTALWTAAINRAKEMWGENWGVAYNGEKVRTQCHGHIHIGRIMPHIENRKFVVVTSPSQIPLRDGEGVWIHGAGGNKMHVHYGEQTTETALMR
jgi:hypothetical protein